MALTPQKGFDRRGRKPAKITAVVIGKPCDDALYAVAARLFKMMQDRPALELVNPNADKWSTHRGH